MPIGSTAMRWLAVVPLVVAGSSCTPLLDTQGLEADLKTKLERQLAGTTITEVRCPDDVAVEAGATFECTVEEESGATFTLKITQVDDRGKVNYEVVDAAA